MFLNVFYRAACIKSTCEYYKFTFDGRKVTFTEPHHSHPPTTWIIVNSIECIRKIFARYYEKKESGSFLTFSPIEINPNLIIKGKDECALKSEKVRDYEDSIFNIPNTQQHEKNRFKQTIERHLKSFSKLLGITYKYDSIEYTVAARINNDVTYLLQQDYHFTFSYPQVYPITPLAVTHPKSQSGLETFFREGQLCKFTFHTKDGSVKAHSVVVCSVAKEFFLPLVNSGMKDAMDLDLRATDTSLQTVQAFLEYAYLSEDGLNQFIEKQETFNLAELYLFASTYQIQSLVDTCTNMLSLRFTGADLETIDQLATRGNNDHLRRLHAHFSQGSTSQTTTTSSLS